MRNLPISKWFPALLIMVMASVSSVFSQTLSIADFSIEAGATQEVTIDLAQGNTPIIGFQCKIGLPAGLTVALDEDNEPNIAAVPGTLKSKKANVIINYSTETGVLLVYNDKNSAYTEEATSVITVEFKADNSFKGGMITLKDIVLSLEGNQKATAEDVTAKVTTGAVVPTTYHVSVANVANGTVTVDKTSAAAGETVKVTATPAAGYELGNLTVRAGDKTVELSADLTFTMPAADVTVTATFKRKEVEPVGNATLAIADFTIDPGATKQVAIKLVKEAGVEIIGFQCKVELPAGLSITLDEEEEPNVSAIFGTLKSSKANIIVNYANGNLLVYNDKNSPYKDDAEGVVLFEFKASDDFAGGVIALKNIVLSLSGNLKVTAEDVTAKVTAGTVVPTTYNISVADAANGTVTVDKTTAAAGETVKVTATPAAGYELESLTVKAGDKTVELSDDFTFVMPAADVTIAATFKQKEIEPTGDAALAIADFTIEPGATKQVTIDLAQGGHSVIGFQCNIELPAGLSIALDEEGEPNIAPVAGAVTSKKANVIVNYSTSTGVLLVYNDKNSPYKADATGVITIEFKAANDFRGGTITLKDVVLSLEGNMKATANDATAKVTAETVVPATYHVSVADAANGTVTVDKTTAATGETVKVTATPAEGYELESLTVKAGDKTVELSADLTFTMPAADVTVTATFKRKEVPVGNATLAIADFTIDPGATQLVTIDLVKGDEAVIGFQCRMELPAGLTVALDEDNEPNIAAVPGTLKSKKANVIVNYSAETGVLLVYNDKNSAYTDEATSVITVEFKADNSFKGGTITLKDIVLSLEGNVKATAEDVTANVMVNPIEPTTYAITVANVANGTVTVDKTSAAAGEIVKINAVQAAGFKLESITVSSASGNIELSADLTFTMPAADVTVSARFTEAKLSTVSIADFNIPSGGTKQITIDLAQGDNPVIGFEFDIDLPDGLAIIGAPKAIAGTLTSAGTPTISYSNGKFIVSNSMNQPFNENATGIFTIELWAADDFDSGTITLSNIVIIEKGNVEVEVANTKTKVNLAIGIADIQANGHYDVYTVNGARILTKATKNDIQSLQRGTYIINGKKVLVK